MDFPEGVATNIYKLDGVLFIQWTVYAPDENESDGASTSISDPCEHDSPGHELGILDIAEQQLRHNGHHVLHDREESTLWVFDLSGPSVKKASLLDERPDAAMVLTRYKLKRITYGSLRASDLTESSTQSWQETELGKGKTTAKPHQPDRELENLHAFQANAWLGSVSSEQATGADGKARSGTPNVCQDVLPIYLKIVSAIMLSLSYSLTRSRLYIPLSSQLLLDHTITLGSEHLESANNTNTGMTIFKLISLGVHWFPSGTLVLMSYPKSGHSFYCFSDLFIDNSHFSPILSPMPVYLAPLGYTGSYGGIEPDICNGEAREQGDIRRREWKSCIKTLLRSKGIGLPDETQWIIVQVHATNGKEIAGGENITRDRNESYTLLWPAHLCFSEVRRDPAQDDGLSWFVRTAEDPGYICDSLLNAENWYMGRVARAEAIESQRRQAELEARLEADTSASDEYDAMSGTLGRYIDAQTLNGIYPTPPDGDRSQAAASSIGHEANDIETRHEGGGMIADSSIEPQYSADVSDGISASPTNDLAAGEYDGLEDEDLFGDMDTEMFTANGLTEADFNFFDEPDDHEEVNMQTTQMISNLNEPIPAQDRTAPVRLPEPGNSTGKADAELSRDGTNDAFGDHSPDPGRYTDGILSPAELIRDSEALRSPRSPQSYGNSEPCYSLGDQHFQPDVRTSQLERMVTPSPNQIEPDYQVSSFAPVKFQSVVQGFDQKYTTKGRFGTNLRTCHASSKPSVLSRKAVGPLPRVGIPVIGLLREHTLQDSTQDEYDEFDDLQSDRDAEMPMTSTPPEDEKDFTKREQCKRKRGSEEDAGTPSSSRFEDDPPSEPAYDDLVLPAVKTLLVYPVDRLLEPLAKPWVISDSAHTFFSGHGKTFIQVAQILADQLVLGASWNEESQVSGVGADMVLPYHDTGYRDPLLHIVPSLFPQAERCSLETCASLGEAPAGSIAISKGASRPVHKKQDVPKAVRDRPNSPQHLFSLPPPDMRVRRGDALMVIAPTSLMFWEELGLGPCDGPKDVIAFCIYPAGVTVERGVRCFLNTMGSTYQSLKLGKHVQGDLGEFAEGLVPVATALMTMNNIIASVEDACKKLGRCLAQIPGQAGNVVVYMVNPFRTLQAQARMCNCFLSLFQAYMHTNTVRQLDNLKELVLKIIPVEFLASNTTIALPSPKQYGRLAMEIYDRCVRVVEDSGVGVPFACSSLFQLAAPIPTTLDFKLTSDPLRALSQRDTSFHIAYSWRPDGQWLTVSLTDTGGTCQWNASYCLGSIGSQPLPVLRNILTEVWQTVTEHVDAKYATCRFFVAKDDGMAQEEIDVWVSLAGNTNGSLIMLVLVAVDTLPPLNAAADSSLSSVDAHIVYATPASTPRAMGLTPEQAANLNTSIEQRNTPKSAEATTDIDANARLVDVTDETWGIITAHSFERSTDGVRTRPAVASGYLLKRAGARDEDGLVMMGLRIVYGEKVNDSLLREIMCVYRSLGTLARARGIVDRVRSVLPLHIATAIKARVGLDLSMRYKAAVS